MADLMTQIGKKNVHFLSLRGEVVGASKWSTTHVSGGGGGGYVHNGTGYSGSMRITSTTTEHDQFFVRTADGKETPIRVSDANLALRDGQDVTVVWGVPEGKNEGPYVALYNHTTDSLTQLSKGIQQLTGKAVGCALIIAAVVGVAILFGINKYLGWIGVAGAGYLLYQSTVQQKQRIKAVDAAIRQLVA